jgi:hypothetical protein
LPSFLRALSSRQGRDAGTAEEAAGPGAAEEKAAAAVASAMEEERDDCRRTDGPVAAEEKAAAAVASTMEEERDDSRRTTIGDPDRPPPAKEKKRRTMLFVSFPLEKSKPGRSPLALSAKEGSRDEQ